MIAGNTGATSGRVSAFDSGGRVYLKNRYVPGGSYSGLAASGWFLDTGNVGIRFASLYTMSADSRGTSAVRYVLYTIVVVEVDRIHLQWKS